MPFNSFTFVLFFAVVLVVHSLPLPWIIRRFNLLLASYLFYAAWDARYIPLLVFSTGLNWIGADLINRWDELPRLRRIVLWASVVLNLGLLAAFKFGNELLAFWQTVADRFGIPYSPPKMTIFLPIGLSFFTFQAMSYTIDVYRRTIKPAASRLDLALFISFFPVLLAGPILRAGQFLPQCARPRRASGDQFGLGIALFILGLFMKVTIADHLLRPVVGKVYDQPLYPDMLTAWLATAAFACQDYCDFAGYSTCAMGLAFCLGFTIPPNFRAPLASIGFRDLWQRWHITLVAWLRDYVFIPLGGVHKGIPRAMLNVIVTFLLVGLWHGATWTMLAFGLLHGLYLVVEMSLQRTRARRLSFWRTAIGIAFIWLTTMALALLAFAFYRSADMRSALRLVGAMVCCGPRIGLYRLPTVDLLIVVFTVQSIAALHWITRDRQLAEFVLRQSSLATSTALAAMAVAIALSGGTSATFLYFQF